MSETVYPLQRLIDAAKACHRANQILCRAMGHHVEQDWAQATPASRGRTMSAVTLLSVQTDARPEQGHKTWLEKMAADGWTYGKTMDVIHKTHPRMVPYEQLPLSQRLSDELFMLIARASLGIDQPQG